MNFTRSIGKFAVLCVLLIESTGCANGLMRTMEEYNFTPLSPPQTKWEGGSIVEVKPNEPSAPILRVTPSIAAAPIILMTADAPDVSRSHDDKADISIGLTLPQGIGLQLKQNGASQYTVVSNGNYIVRVPLDPYALNTFPIISGKYAGFWGRALDDHELYYVYELWYAKSLEYKFYNSAGGSISVDAKAIKIPAELQANYALTDSGSVIYKGQDAICLGYKRRPIVVRREGPTAGIVAEAAGQASARSHEAKVEYYEKK